MSTFSHKLLLTIKAFSTLVLMCIGLNFSSAKAETTECTQIMTLPAVITVQGIYCFKTNLVTSITTGNAIEIQTNNVTIDMNGFKLGGSTAGTGTLTSGIYANGQKNITIHNGIIRGFLRGIWLDGASGSGHLIENIRADGNRFNGFQVYGGNNIIRNNHVINTGGTTQSSSAYGIYVSLASNTLVADNVVSSVSETLATNGIYIQNSSKVKVQGNTIFEIKDATNKYGIFSLTSTEITVVNNRIINPVSTGTTGIIDGGSSTGVDCIENIIRGYTSGLIGCDYTSGNHIN